MRDLKILATASRMWLSVFAIIAAVGFFSMAMQPAQGQLEGVTNLNGLHLNQTSFGTATPQVMVQNGGSGVSLEVRNSSATPVWKVDGNGVTSNPPNSLTSTGAVTLTVAAEYYEVAPSAVLTLTLTGGSAGDDLIIANTVTTSTVIVDTGATVGGGNITLGENDLAVFKNVDGTWAEVASPDNS